MPVIGTPTTPPVSPTILSPDDIRTFLRDKADPEYNILIDGIDFKDNEINAAIDLVVDHYNIIPPPIGKKSGANFPSKLLLMYGVSGHLLKGEAARQARNQVQYQDGDISIGLYNKAEIFLNLGSLLWNEYVGLVKQYKISQNMEGGYGSFSSFLSYDVTTLR